MDPKVCVWRRVCVECAPCVCTLCASACACVCARAQVSGEPTIAVPGGQTKEYTMKLSPQLGGQYTGSVNFTHPTTGEFSWYTVEVSVDAESLNTIA